MSEELQEAFQLQSGEGHSLCTEEGKSVIKAER